MRARKLAIFVAVSLVMGLAWLNRPEPPALRVWMLDVGQGESVLVQEPDGRTLLFDGGPDDRVLSQLGSVLPYWKREIDLMVLSHTHLDHVAGLISVLGRYSVREIWISGAYDTTAEFKEFSERVSAKAIPVRRRFWNDTPCTDICPVPENFGSARIQLYHPIEDMTGQKPSQQHDADLVIKVSYGTRSLLLTGDLNEEHERDMLAACAAPRCSLRADVLQIPHHGSATGLVPEFLAAIHPGVALIPVGTGNRYHHPTVPTLQKLADAGIPLYRTDTQGRLYLRLDAHGIQVQKERDG